MMKKAILKLGYSCNNNCIFCHASDKKRTGITLSSEDIKKKILTAKEHGTEMLLLSGGEASIREDIIDIMKFLRKNNILFGLITNGRMLSYQNFAVTAKKLGLTHTYISLHGTEDIHNHLTNTKSYKQTMKGIRNLIDLDIPFTVNIVVNKFNVEELIEISDEFIKNSITDIRFSNLIISGNAMKHFDILTPDINHASLKVKEAIKFCIGHGARAGYEGFPVCLMGEYAEHVNNLESNEIELISESYEDHLYPRDAGDKIRMNECILCQDRRCDGIESEYLKRKDPPKLYPKIELIPNSFNMVMSNRFSFDNRPECPIRYDFSGFARTDVLLIDENNVSRFIVDSSDFDNKTIIDTKERGQLYLNLSDNTLSDDFAKDYSKLIMIDACKKCIYRKECCNCFKQSGTISFEDDDSTIRSAISEMKGNVLDIGCGNIRYTKELSNPEIKYLGLEPNPDESTIDEANLCMTSNPGNKKKNHNPNIINTTFEDFNPDTAFDNILLLRSINHIKRPDLAISKCCDMLDKGGKILICDNSVFGLLQNIKGKGNIPMTGEPGREWEHYHNLHLSDIKRLISSMPLDIVESSDINSNKSNQWHIILRKREVE